MALHVVPKDAALDEPAAPSAVLEEEWKNVLGCGAMGPPDGDAQRFHADDDWIEMEWDADKHG